MGTDGILADGATRHGDFAYDRALMYAPPLLPPPTASASLSNSAHTEAGN